MAQQERDFSRYEIARILGARALQIAMDAPLLLKISEEKLKEIKYDSLMIAEEEFESGVLPISVKRPMPSKNIVKLQAVKEEKVDDKTLIAKEKEIEKEIKESAEEMGLVDKDDSENLEEDSGDEER